MTAMNGLVRQLLALAVLLFAAGCTSGGPAGSRSGCYSQPSAGSQGYDERPMFFLFCNQSP